MIKNIELRTQVFSVARAQHRVVTAHQLRDCGVDRNAARRAVHAHVLFPITSRVYATCELDELTLDGWAMASVLMRSAPTASSGVTAVIRLGGWDRGPVVVEATTLGASGRTVAPAAPGGGFHHRRGLDVSTIGQLRGVPTLTPIHACRQLGTRLTPLQITFLLREFVRRRDFSIEQFEAVVRDAGAFHGAALVREAITWFHGRSAGTRGPNEDELCRLLETSGVPFPLVNVRGATGHADIECDFVWLERRLAVELNDRRHLLPGAAEADEEKRRRLEADGWRVEFIPGWRVWQDPRGTISTIRTLLAGDG